MNAGDRAVGPNTTHASSEWSQLAGAVRVNSSLRKKAPKAIEPASFYKFEADCSFRWQYTFSASEVWHADDGDEADFEPTGEALAVIEREVRDFLINAGFPVRSVDANSEFDDAMHPMSSADDVADGYTFGVLCSFIVDFVILGAEVEHDSTNNRSRNYLRPTDNAVLKLKEALREALEQGYGISDLEVDAATQDFRQCVKLYVPRHIHLNVRRPAGRRAL